MTMLILCDSEMLCSASVSIFGGSGRPIRIICSMSPKMEGEFKKDFDRWLRPFFSSEDSTVLSKCSSSFHRERSTKSCPSFLITSEMFNPPSFNEFFNDIKVFDVLRAQFIERSGGAVGNMFLSCEYLIFFNIKAQANDFSVWLADIFESCSKRLSAVSGVPKMG